MDRWAGAHPARHFDDSVKEMNKIYAKARSRIIWGDKPDSVTDCLLQIGVSKEEVNEIIQSLLSERYDAVRKRGAVHVLKGFAVILGCVGFISFMLSDVDSLNRISAQRIGGLAIPTLGLLWAIVKVINGLLNILAPGRFKGNSGIDAG